jgi:hypothetical protein
MAYVHILTEYGPLWAMLHNIFSSGKDNQPVRFDQMQQLPLSSASAHYQHRSIKKSGFMH